MGVARVPRLRIVTALLVALILVSIVPLALLHFNLIGINRDALETAEKKYLKNSSVTLADSFDTYITNAQSQLKKIADGIRLASSMSTDPFFYLSKKQLLREYSDAESSFPVLRALDRDGVASADSDPLDPDVERPLRQAYNAAMRGESYVADPIFPKSYPDGALVLAVPVRPSEGQEPIGVVEALLSLRPIKAKLDEEGRGGVLAYVVDRSGSLVLTSDASAFSSKDVHQLDLVSEFIAHPVRITKSYMRGEGKAARRVLGTLATIPTPDWGVIVEKDEEAAYASVSQMKRESSKIAVFSLLFAAFVAVVAARLLAHPLVELVEKVRSIAEGSFKQRVEVRGVRELAELSETFNSMSDSIEKSVDKLKLAAKENQELFINSVRTLAAAIDAKDPYTRGHSERVARYAVVLARHMDLSPEEVRVVRLSALLHDVGKIGIDDRILRKPTALTSEEFEIMKTHPAKGALIMGQIPQLKDVIPGIKYHHEKWSGGGYPDGLKGEGIPMVARVVAVADTFDAMTTTRPYQKAMPINYVITQIMSFAGKSFDPAVIAALDKAWSSGDFEFLGEDVPLKASA
ncbi:MAG: HD domain-containing phosphohydrolase [Acidobacteriota bacterium]